MPTSAIKVQCAAMAYGRCGHTHKGHAVGHYGRIPCRRASTARPCGAGLPGAVVGDGVLDVPAFGTNAFAARRIRWHWLPDNGPIKAPARTGAVRGAPSRATDRLSLRVSSIPTGCGANRDTDGRPVPYGRISHRRDVEDAVPYGRIPCRRDDGRIPCRRASTARPCGAGLPGAVVGDGVLDVPAFGTNAFAARQIR